MEKYLYCEVYGKRNYQAWLYMNYSLVEASFLEPRKPCWPHGGVLLFMKIMEPELELGNLGKAVENISEATEQFSD